MSQPATASAPAESDDISQEEVLARFIAEAAMDKKALDVTIIDVQGKTSYADFLVLCTATNERHVEAIGRGVDEALSEYRDAFGREGHGGHWILLDYSEVIVHIFLGPARRHYDLDGLWSDVPRLALDIPDDLRAEPGVYDGYIMD